MTTVKHVEPDMVQKADISVPVPSSMALRFSSIGSANELADGTSRKIMAVRRRAQYNIYYDMYRQHPTLRAAIEKVAKVTVQNGFLCVPSDNELALDKVKAKAIQKFLRKSNAMQLIRLTAKDLGIYGEAYWWVQRARGNATNGIPNGQPLMAKRLHPKYIDPKSADGINVTSYSYSVTPDDVKATSYDPSCIIHFKLEDPDDDLHGLSLLFSLQRTVANDLFAMEYNGKFFENSAQTGIIFNMKNASQDEVDRNRAWLEENYIGASNAHRPLILEGDIDVQKSVAAMADMQFLEGRTFNRQEILSVLDVPGEKLQITGHSNRSTAKESDNTFRSESLVGWQSIIEEEINNRLILDMFGWDDTLFQLAQMSMRDLLDLTTMFTALLDKAVFNVNEIRGQFGYSNVKGGDVNSISASTGIIPLDQVEPIASTLATPKPTAIATAPDGSPAKVPQGAGAPVVNGPKGHAGTPRIPGKPGRPGHSGEPGKPGQAGGSGAA